MKFRVRMDEVVEAESFDDLLGVLAKGMIDGAVNMNTGFESLDTRLAAEQGHANAHPRRFLLQRDEDETGLSGVGVVAWGVEFPDGKAVTRWKAKVAQTCTWDCIEDVIAVHGHQGRTRIVYLD